MSDDEHIAKVLAVFSDAGGQKYWTAKYAATPSEHTEALTRLVEAAEELYAAISSERSAKHTTGYANFPSLRDKMALRVSRALIALDNSLAPFREVKR